MLLKVPTSFDGKGCSYCVDINKPYIKKVIVTIDKGITV